MKNNRLLKALTMVLCLVLALAFFTNESFAITKGEVDASVKAALARFQKEVKGAPEYLKAAKGVVVMPNITKAGFIVGAQYGTGPSKLAAKPPATTAWLEVPWDFKPVPRNTTWSFCS